MTLRRRPAPPAAGLASLLAVVLAAGAVAGCGDGGPARAALSVTALLAGDDTAGFARAETRRVFSFPGDHGPHPGFRHEWWYFTGNLRSDDGRRYGFMLTFFRSALRPGSQGIESAWATDQAFMAHFAVTDVARGRFHASERFDRGALGLAYARGRPFQVGVAGWSARAVRGAVDEAAPFPAMRVAAADGDVAIDLLLEPLKPAVLQGERGLSRKGPEPGNASYYYSMTRLDARGVVTVGGESVPVSGLAWLDREWGTSALGPELEGWDWFSVQLDDGFDLMYYQLRRRDGSADPLSRGSVVDTAGRAIPITARDVVLRATGHWTGRGGARYPSGWRLAVPDLGLDLRIDPALSDQEMDLTFRYWEGAVDVAGTRRGAPVRGHGYVELTGYAPSDGGSSTGRPRNRSAR